MTSKGFQEYCLTRKTTRSEWAEGAAQAVTKQLPALTASVKAQFASAGVSSTTGRSVRHSCTSTYLLDDTILKRTKMLIFSLRPLSGGGWGFISPTLVHKRKSRNASKQRQIPMCSQGLPHWPYSNRRAFAVIGSDNKHGPAVTAAHNCSLNTFKYPGGISQMRARSP